MGKQLIRISTSGSVDDGKSTLLGRLLFDSKNLNKDDIEKIRQRSNLDGKIDYSLFTDGLKDEIHQGITIDVAYRYFSTKKRKFIVSDSPGHTQYTRNMITGSSLSNLMIVLVDVNNGITDQTKRHLFISSLLHIDHIVICVNKMDLVNYHKEKYEQIKNELEKFISKLNLKDINYIPISALNGENITKSSSKMDWYDGPTLMFQIENIHISSDYNKIQSRFFVQNIVRTENNESRFIQGKIQSGIFREGDEILVHPKLSKVKIKSIIYNNKKIKTCFSPMSISFLVCEDVDISRGDLITKKNSLPKIAKEIEVTMCWLSETSLTLSKKYMFQRNSELLNCKVTSIKYKYNIKDLSRNIINKDISVNDIFKCKIRLSKEISFDSFSQNKQTGSFILIDDQNNTCGCGMIY
tara:strand:+ start:98 stop:1327 length:1230 start_codon:yes stop_codon:yes gene_type:complete